LPVVDIVSPSTQRLIFLIIVNPFPFACANVMAKWPFAKILVVDDVLHWNESNAFWSKQNYQVESAEDGKTA